MKLTFRKMGINGEGIAYQDHTPVFCDGVFPGESAEVEITEVHRNYKKAELKKITWFSKERVKTSYPCYTEEGCPLFPMKYPAQLSHKKQLLEEALWKYAKIRKHFVRDMRGSEITLGYRNQCKLPVQESDGHITTGMYMPGTNHFHPISKSLIQDPVLERSRRYILKCIDHSSLKAYDEKKQKGLRYLVIRAIDGNVQCTLVTGKDTISENLILDIMKTDGMTGLFQSINTERNGASVFGSSVHKLAGNNTMPVKVNGITLQLSPESFFQLNVPQARSLYNMAVSKIDPCNTLVEAYCGIGAMSLLAHQKAKHIYGIESVKGAVENAKQNALSNHINNAEFLCMDAGEGLRKISSGRTVDCLIADPPRSGMDENMIQAILEAKPKKIIYISCNPATLARNLNVLKHQYHVVTIIPYDLFPHTPHVESLTVLERDNYTEKEKED